MSNNLTESFFEGTPSMMTDEPPADFELLQIATTLTQGEASALDKRIDLTAKSLYTDLCEMRDKEGWHALGFASWDKYLRSKSGKIGMDYTTVLRKLQAGDTRTALTSAGVSVKGLADTHARELSRLPQEQRAEGWQRAQEIAAEYQPTGKAAEHHFPGKVLTSHVEQAVSELLQFATSDEDGEPDPYDPNDPRNKPDFFSPENRQKVLNDAKPLPPSQSAQQTRTEPELPEEEVYVFAGIEESKEPGIWYVFGDDGIRRVVIPIRADDLKQIFRK